MPLDPAANFVRTTTDTVIDNSQTTLSVADASGFPDPNTEGEYNIVVWAVESYPRPDQDPDVEIMRVTGRDTTNDNLTVTRGREDTVAVGHPSGSAVQVSATAKMFSDIQAKTSGLSDDGAKLDIDSIYTNSRVSPVVVWTDGTTWYADGENTRITSGTDPGTVLQTALDNSDNVKVTTTQAAATATTDTTVTHDSGYLEIDRDLFWHYTGTTGEAFTLSSDGLGFHFGKIESDGDYVIRSLGLGTAHVTGHRLFGGSDSIWYYDAANQSAARANNLIEIQWLDCSVDDTPVGVKYGSSAGDLIEGNFWVGTVIYGPGDIGVQYGTSEGVDNVRNNAMLVDIDGQQGTGTRLAEFYSRNNGLYLKGWTSAPNGDHDITVYPGASGSYIDGNHVYELRIDRQELVADMPPRSMQDTRRQTCVECVPDSLDGYSTTGSVSLDTSTGEVVQSTGSTSGSFSTARKLVPDGWADDGILSWEHRESLAVRATFEDASAQRAWLIHGDRGGPGYGFHVVNGDLLGFVHDGSAQTDATLVSGFASGTTFDLVALYNSPRGVDFYVDGSYAGSIESGLPSGIGNVTQVFAADLVNDEGVDKVMRWNRYQLENIVQ